MSARASLVIPLLNQKEAWLEQCLLSALRQTVPCEVVVVISPRTRESNRAVIARLQAGHREFRMIEREPQMAFAAALNLGIRSAGAGRIGFLLSDDWLSPVAVERCLALDADIVSTGRTFFAADGVTELPSLSQEHSDAGFKRLRSQADRASYLKHFFLFRREALDAVGGVDETLGDAPGVDDFDLIWCLLDRRASVAILEEKLYNYRDHEKERLTLRRREEMFATFNRILDKHRIAPAERERLLREHGPWFGRTLSLVWRELSRRRLKWSRRPFARLYGVVPLETRLAIGERLQRRGRNGS